MRLKEKNIFICLLLFIVCALSVDDIRLEQSEEWFQMNVIYRLNKLNAQEQSVLPQKADDSKTADVVFSNYQKKIRELVRKCENNQMPLEAEITRKCLFNSPSLSLSVPLLPHAPIPKTLPEDSSEKQRRWFKELYELRTQYSESMYQVALELSKKRKGYDVVSCILTALFINPDHQKSREFLGYSLFNGEWLTKWEKTQVEKGLVKTQSFGWIPKEHVQEYKNGKRFYRNQWYSSEEVDQVIKKSNTGWQLETEHFSVLSRISLERSVEICDFLELYYQVWIRLFYRFVATESQWNARIYSSRDLVSKQHKIIIYRSRDEYLRELSKYDANSVYSIGGYFPSLHCLFIYDTDENDRAELFALLSHEATHQLFEECNTAVSSRTYIEHNKRATIANFWPIEGIAVYSESFRINMSHSMASLGTAPENPRLLAAQQSLFMKEDYIPLREFARLSRTQFQQRRDLAHLYSQSAGLTSFFMHVQNGLYRDAFIRYLHSIYQGTDKPDSLETLTGKTFEELDQEYRIFMKSVFHETIQ